MTDIEKLMVITACEAFNSYPTITKTEQKLVKTLMEDRKKVRNLEHLSRQFYIYGYSVNDLIEGDRYEWWRNMIKTKEFYNLFHELCCSTNVNVSKNEQK